MSFRASPIYKSSKKIKSNESSESIVQIRWARKTAPIHRKMNDCRRKEWKLWHGKRGKKRKKHE